MENTESKERIEWALKNAKLNVEIYKERLEQTRVQLKELCERENQEPAYLIGFANSILGTMQRELVHLREAESKVELLNYLMSE